MADLCDCGSKGGSTENLLFNDVAKTPKAQHFFRRLAGAKTETAKRAFNSITRRTKPDLAVHQQTECALFQLPPEITDKIWEYSLRKPKSMLVHFHVYDKVYDFCTWSPCTDCRLSPAYNRAWPTKLSLLLTCRAAYIEAVQFLYDQCKFELVLMAGFARPRAHIKGEQSVGRLQDCAALFGRMRKLTLRVSPGAKPCVRKYKARIATLLDVLDYGKHTRSFCLHFNWHWGMDTSDPSYKHRDAIIRAFEPIAEPLASMHQSRRHDFRLQIGRTPGSQSIPWLDEYMTVFKLGRSRLKFVRFGTVGESSVGPTPLGCLLCGVRLRRLRQPPRDDSTSEAIRAITLDLLVIALFPITMPIVCLGYAWHRRQKGEW